MTRFNFRYILSLDLLVLWYQEAPLSEGGSPTRGRQGPPAKSTTRSLLRVIVRE